MLTQSTYTVVLTATTQTYRRICGKGKYHYETIQINVRENGIYDFNTNSTDTTFGSIYKNDFNPSYPNDNLLVQSDVTCTQIHFQFATYLQINMTYILVLTTRNPNVKGVFSVFVTGPNKVSMNRTCEYL